MDRNVTVAVKSAVPRASAPRRRSFLHRRPPRGRQTLTDVPVGILLVPVVRVAATQTFHEIAQREGEIGFKLLCMSKLVQEEFRIGLDARREKDSAADRDSRGGRLPERPSGDANQQSAATQPDAGELRP